METEELEILRSDVQQLLDLCARNNVEVPDDLKQNLHKNIHIAEERFRTHTEYLKAKNKEAEALFDENGDILERAKVMREKLKLTSGFIDVRIKNGKYTATNYYDDDIQLMKRGTEDDGMLDHSNHRAKQKIETVRTSSPLYKLYQTLLKCIVNKGDIRKRKEEAVLMEGVNLVLEQGKMYLVLGAPGSGKSIVQKMIAGNLLIDNDHQFDGEVSICGLTPDDKDVIWTNLVSYIDQIDRLHPYLTVFETCEFAWKARSGGTHREYNMGSGDDIDEVVAKMDEEKFIINTVLQGLGLARVRDTFVGDTENVRGVSGGERKRVTVAEMTVVATPVRCNDEISTGLDAATTYDITRLMAGITKIFETIQVVSLLQPPPETVANFDDLILLSEGHVIYTGPIDEVVEYFQGLGYSIPERMDVADWLQALPTREGWIYLSKVQEHGGDATVLPEPLMKELKDSHMTTKEFHARFYESERGRAILAKLEEPMEKAPDNLRAKASVRYRNSTFESLKLLTQRELLLWWRDKYQINAKLAQALVMGLVAGTLFWDSSGNAASLVSILFQSLLYGTIGAMTSVAKQFPTRGIFYKQQDANFFPTWVYVFGRSIGNVPTALIDAVGYGTIIYFFAGLARNDGATIGSYFVFMIVLFFTTFCSIMFFSMFSASVQTLTSAQAMMALSAVMFLLFSGFTVQPDVIPSYYIWVYWLNYIAWDLRAIVVNEFDSGAYDTEVAPGLTEGEAILTQYGFTLNDEPFDRIWVLYGVLVSMVCAIASLIVTAYALSHIRFSTGKSLVTDQGDDEIEEIPQDQEVTIPFQRANLTFKDVHYTVKSSISDEKLELLKGIDGVVEAGRMTALMGSSGAGKTTLMDVLALRKSSGEITGDVRLNGHPQEEVSFRRCTGYVEQFDTQSAQLTIRETMEFSAKLRLDEKDPSVTDESRSKFVDQVLNMLELTNLQDLQVGSDETGGLSFEQKKRLSIAVEVVANPSILFLDEPTSGLDARAASIVMRGLRRVADSGRAVCATIHQPSIAIFNEFDALLLLKRGGEVVFFGDLGDHSSNLIHYLESYTATPRIQPGENPATWMLTTIGAGSASPTAKPFDYAGNYSASKLRINCLERIDDLNAKATPDNEVSFETPFATSFSTQVTSVMSRIMTIYFRSPDYNTIRLMVAFVVAMIYGSVYASQRVPENESDMNSRINSIFMALIFMCVYGQNSVLLVFQSERNMFYRHKAAKMYSPAAILGSLTVAEIPFLFLTATVFTLAFYFIMGFSTDPDKFFTFYFFVFLAIATYTFLGQMLMSLFRDTETAQGFGGLIIGFSSLFAGILIRPSDIPTFWVFMYWLMPGQYIFESLFTSQFNGDDTLIEASVGSSFYTALKCTPDGSVCKGTISQWLEVNFSDFSEDHLGRNVGYLVGLLAATRIIAFIALNRLNYRAT